MRTISRLEYKKVAQFFHWATILHFILWLTGKVDRHKRTEVMLKRLVDRGELIAVRYGHKLIYTAPRRKNDKNYEHGLGCTEGLVRFWKSDPCGMIIPERHLRGFGVVPEWGIRYKNGKMLLFEFCTASNFYKYGLIGSKISRYNQGLHLIEGKYDAEAIVVFVCDVSRRDVDEYVWKRKTPGNEVFYFVDYDTFKSVPIGQQLTEPIYIWGEDCWPYPLREENG